MSQTNFRVAIAMLRRKKHSDWLFTSHMTIFNLLTNQMLISAERSYATLIFGCDICSRLMLPYANKCPLWNRTPVAK